MEDQKPGEHGRASAPDAPKNVTNIIIGVLAVIVGILLIAILQQNRPASEQTPASSTEEAANDVTEPAIPAVNFAYTDIEVWEHTSRAQEDIQELARGQVLEFGVVTDPSDPTFAYFATSVYDDRKKENLVGVYKYNVENYSFERLFRRSYSAGDFTMLGEDVIPVFHVVGYDDGRLVILAQDMNDSPGPCAQPLLLGAEQSDARALISMSITDAYAGFETYTLSDDVRRAAETAEQTCLSAL